VRAKAASLPFRPAASRLARFETAHFTPNGLARWNWHGRMGCSFALAHLGEKAPTLGALPSPSPTAAWVD
jgi:hypothetical protein